jgi:predicted DNA-binding transcriptional regulator YafY
MPGRAYDDPAHPEVVVALTYQGARMAEDLPHCGDAVRQVGESAWELRLRCPPSDLPYWARTFFGFGPHARVAAPAKLREMIAVMIRATAENYADILTDGDGLLSPIAE